MISLQQTINQNWNFSIITWRQEHLYIHPYIPTYTHTHMHIHIHLHLHLHIHIHMHIHIHIHTQHTHTHKPCPIMKQIYSVCAAQVHGCAAEVHYILSTYTIIESSDEQAFVRMRTNENNQGLMRTNEKKLEQMRQMRTNDNS